MSVWQIYAKGPPRQIHRSKVEALSSLFQSYRDLWKPAAIHRAKSIGQADATYQLDFVDVGLIPAIEGEIHQKLDRLLRDALPQPEEETSIADTAALFQGVFRLLAAKTLIDRKHEWSIGWDTSDVASVLSGIGKYYRLPGEHFDPLHVQQRLESAWRVLSRGLNVANVSADDLAFVYENTLVTPTSRRVFSTHSTPRHVASYIVRRLSFWGKEPRPLKIYEPFSGAGVFLVSTLRYMRESLPHSWTDRQRHDFLVRNIRGSELDTFTCEVATLSLILADYPNTNGWQIENLDLFEEAVLETRLADADVVLCNPPFGVFTEAERLSYPTASGRSGSRAISVLSATLEAKPEAIGFVLPRTFLLDRTYRNYRKAIEATYREVELVSLPDGVFTVSQVETALLIARDRVERPSDREIVSSEVDDADKRSFSLTGMPTRSRAQSRARSVHVNGDLWIPPLGPLWDRLDGLPRLGDFFSGHWGVRWTKGVQSRAAVERGGPHCKSGLLNVHDHRQFQLGKPVLLNMDPKVLYAGGNLPWDQHKILCNAARLSRGYWRLAAALDEEGLIASQQFIGLWPRGDIEVVEFNTVLAILNGPVTNAFMSDHSTEKRFRISTLLRVPLPMEVPAVVGMLVQEYQNSITQDLFQVGSYKSAVNILDEIDRLILEAFDFPPRSIRGLLAGFGSSERPVTHPWPAWNVNLNEPALTLTEVREGALNAGKGKWVREELAPVSETEAACAAPYLP